MTGGHRVIRESSLRIGGLRIPLYSLNTLIVGSGAAGLNAAVRLHDFGVRDIAITTEAWDAGTSRNSGSDKQTYYKLSLAGSERDSPLDMARDLFAGGSMHGDIALSEAVNSLPAFFHLVSLGVPFPHDRFGTFVGYKTDNDPRQRATSAGPLTSRLMCDRLGDEVRRKGIRVFDRHQVVSILTAGKGKGKSAVGALALDKNAAIGRNPGFVAFNAVNIVLATGGPGGMYKHSVYPEDQWGSHGLAFEAGAVAHNLTESQFGLASVKFRWNLSGAYQQAVPRYFSTDRRGGDEREFLNDEFPDMGSLSTAVFLKGYEWPFDPRKAGGFGSSLIDLLVYRETVLRKRRVFLDYLRNPQGGGGRGLKDFRLKLLSEEAYAYLEKSGALLETPLARLRRLNTPSIELYRSHGIDLAREPLEAAVCAQHNNGGFVGSTWWESTIRRLFPVGEVNGTHGVYRPGGAALNSGQVGSLRAAQFISRHSSGTPPPVREFRAAAWSEILAKLEQARRIVGRGGDTKLIPRAVREIRERMSACGAQVRSAAEVRRELPAAWKLLNKLRREIAVRSPKGLPRAFLVLDLCLTHALYLEAIAEYIVRGGRSRGSYIILDGSGENSSLHLGWKAEFSLAGKGDFVNRMILEIGLDERMKVRKKWTDIRPLPRQESWFEAVWRDFREGKAFR